MRGLPPGLGSYVQWDRKLDGRLAQAVMSIPAIKAVGIGKGVGVARRARARRSTTRSCLPAAGGGRAPGRRAADQPRRRPRGRRHQRRGPPRHRLHEADLDAHEAAAFGGPQTMQESPAAIERSDVCAVPAAAVVAEAMVAFVLADAVLERFGARHARRHRGGDRARATRGAAALPPRTRRGVTSMRRPILRYGEPVLHTRPRPSPRVTPRDRRADRRHARDDARRGRASGWPRRRSASRCSSVVVDLSAGRRSDQLLVLINPDVRRARRPAARGGGLPERARHRGDRAAPARADRAGPGS